MVDYSKSIYDYLRASYDGLGKKSFVEFYGKKTSFERLFDKIDAVAENLARFGVGKGTVVTVSLPNCPQFIILTYALAKLGAIGSFVSPLMSQPALEKVLSKTGSKILVISTLCPHKVENVSVIRVHFNAFMPALKKAVLAIKKHYAEGFSFESLFVKPQPPFIAETAVDPSAPAFYLHSGGTTGEPKTVILSQRAVNYCAATISANLAENDLHPTDEINCAFILPLFYGYGLGVMHTQMTNGYNHFVRAKFNPAEFAEMFAKNNVNLMFGIPTMYRKMLQTGAWTEQNVKDLRLCYIGGERLSKELAEEFAAAFPHGLLVEGYGMTEAVTAFLAGSKHGVKENSCGRVNAMIKVETFDENSKPLPRGREGELCVCTQAVMNGYLQDEETTRNTLFDYKGERWLRTGDYGKVDEEGYVFLMQRIKNIIKRKGINIFPLQVELCVMELPFIKEVKVFGYKDSEEVERIVCAVTVTENAPQKVAEAVKSHVKNTISIISTPEYVLVKDALPTTNVGKVDVKALTQDLLASGQLK